MLVLGLVDGTLAITGRGLTRGAVATMLQPHGLIAEGNALMNLGFAASSVFGAALAGGLIAFFGLSVALLVDAASFLIIALVARDLQAPPPARAHRLPAVARAASAPGCRSRARTGSCARCSIGQSLALICFTLVVPIEVIYAKETLGTTSAGFGVLLSAWGAGIVLGSVLFIGLKHRTGFGLIMISTRGRRASPTSACHRRRRCSSRA